MHKNHGKGSLKRSRTEETVPETSIVAAPYVSSDTSTPSLVGTQLPTPSVTTNPTSTKDKLLSNDASSQQSTHLSSLPATPSFSLPFSLCHMTPGTYLHTNKYTSYFTDMNTSGPFLYSLLQQENNILVNGSLLYHHTLPSFLPSSSSSSSVPPRFPRYKSIHTIDPSLFDPSRQSEITPRMRALLIDWLSNTCEQYLLRRYTFHRAVMILDRYLGKRHHLPRELFHCVGATCLHIAAKFEEIHYPSLNEIMEATNNKVTKPMMKSMELEICHTLGWNVQPPTVLHWLGNICQHIGIAADSVHRFVQSLQRNSSSSHHQPLASSTSSSLPSSSSSSTIQIMDSLLVTPELFVSLLTCENGVDDEGYPVVQRYCMNVHHLPLQFPIEMPLHVIGRLSMDLSSSVSPASITTTTSLPSLHRIPAVHVPTQTAYSPHLPTKLFLDCATLADNCMMHIRSTAYVPSILSAAIVLVVLKQYEVDAQLSIQEANCSKYSNNELEELLAPSSSKNTNGKENEYVGKLLLEPTENDNIFTGTSDAAVLLRLANLRSLVLAIIRQGIFRTLPMKMNTLHSTPSASASSVASPSLCYVPIDPYTTIDNVTLDRDYLWLLLEDACNWVYRMSMSMPNFHAHPYITQALEAPEPALRVTKPELCLLQTSHEKMLNHVLERLDEHKHQQEVYQQYTKHHQQQEAAKQQQSNAPVKSVSVNPVTNHARPPFTLQDGPIRNIIPELRNDWSNLGINIPFEKKEEVILQYYQQAQYQLYHRTVEFSSASSSTFSSFSSTATTAVDSKCNVFTTSDTVITPEKRSSVSSKRTIEALPSETMAEESVNISKSLITKTENRKSNANPTNPMVTSIIAPFVPPTKKPKRSKTASSSSSSNGTIQIISNILPLKKMTQTSTRTRSTSTQRLITDSLMSSAMVNISSTSNSISHHSSQGSVSNGLLSQDTTTNPPSSNYNDVPSSQSSSSSSFHNENNGNQYPHSSAIVTEFTELSQSSQTSTGSIGNDTETNGKRRNSTKDGSTLISRSSSHSKRSTVLLPSTTTGLGTSSHRARQMAKLASHHPSSVSGSERMVAQGTIETPSVTVRENTSESNDGHKSNDKILSSNGTVSSSSSVHVVRRLAGSLY